MTDTETKFNGSPIFRQVVTRDTLGRIETLTETDVATTSYAYSYDVAGRLWQVMKDGVLSSTYLYDANGNRTSKTTPGGTETGIADGQDRLLNQGPSTFGYTANGELRTKTDTASGAVTTYGYDGFANLRRVDLPDGRAIEYVVDGLGRRVAKKINGVVVKRWIYSGALIPVAELDASGAVESRIVSGEYIVKGGATYRIVKDHLGSPRVVVDTATGVVAQRMSFDEYGRVLADSAPGFQPLGYAGGLYDPDTGLLRFGARDYDPTVGRWTVKDPILFPGGEGNSYLYVLDGPINAIDPSGLTTLDLDVAGGKLTVDPEQPGRSPYTIDVQSGGGDMMNDPNSSGVKSTDSNVGGPIPAGNWFLKGRVQDLKPSVDWGPWRIRIWPRRGTDTKERDHLYIHSHTKKELWVVWRRTPMIRSSSS